MLGDESYLDATFDRDEQVIVKNYLQNGGRLFVSGSEVGYDLANLGNSYDQFFFSDFLKAKLMSLLAQFEGDFQVWN